MFKIFALLSGFINPKTPNNKVIVNIDNNWHPVPNIDDYKRVFTDGGLNTSPATCFQSDS